MEVLSQLRPYPREFTPQAGWDVVWRAARDGAASAPARVAIIGDSIGQGAGAASMTRYTGNGFDNRLRNKLTGLYGVSADFIPPGYSSAWLGAYATGTPPWSISATGLSWVVSGLLVSPQWAASAPATCASFTLPSAGTVELWYRNVLAGTPGFNWRIGAGATTNVNTTAGGYPAKVNLGAQSAGAVVNLNALVNGACVPLGCTVINNGSAGIAFAFGGTASSQVSGLGQENLDFVAGKTAAGTWANQGFPAEPHLAILHFGINDCTGISKAGPIVFEQMLVTLINYLRRARANCSILIIVASNPDNVTSDTTAQTGISNVLDWPLFMAAMYRVGRSMRCGVLDMNWRWGQTPFGSGFRPAADVHPNDTGFADYETALEAILL